MDVQENGFKVARQARETRCSAGVDVETKDGAEKCIERWCSVVDHWPLPPTASETTYQVPRRDQSLSVTGSRRARTCIPPSGLLVGRRSMGRAGPHVEGRQTNGFTGASRGTRRARLDISEPGAGSV